MYTKIPRHKLATEVERLSRALADRYRFERELGRGGMATVYLAADLKHHRSVAIKVLRSELGQLVGAERFLREIEVTAQLDHPHILPLLDSGEADGVLYYVMPFVEGESLRDRLDRQKQLPLDDALQIAREVADALTYAHRRGIVHRDIKPENVLLAAGHARVADFGIARALSAAGGDKLTATGLAIGTPAYMSPEQGSEEVDGRSDIYSLGCVLYEMLAGDPPFTGSSAQVILARKSVDQIPSLRTVRETLPLPVERAVGKALARVPADRFATAAQFVEALKLTSEESVELAGASPERSFLRARTIALLGGLVLIGVAVVVLLLRGPSTELSVNRVVVVPFENRTRQDSLGGWGRAVADWINAGLVGIGLGVQVVPATDVVQVLGSAEGAGGVSARSLAQRTGAVWIIRGAYYQQGDSLRFEVEIVDGRRGTVAVPVDPVMMATGAPTEGFERVRGPVLAAMATLLQDPNFRTSGPGRRPTTLEATAVWALVGAAAERGDFPEALRQSRIAWALDTTDRASLGNVFWSYYNVGDYDAADSILQILDRHRSELSAEDRLVIAWQRALLRGDHEAVYQMMRTMMRADEGRTEEMPALSWAAYRSNRPREAVNVLERVPSSSHSPSVYYYYAMGAYHTLQRHRDELREARRGREAYSQDLVILQGEVVAQAARGLLSEVRLLLKESLTLPAADSTIWTAALRWQECDENAQLAPPVGTPGSVARTAALEFRAHGSQAASREMVERALAWYGSLAAGTASHPRHRWGRAQTLYLAERWREARHVAAGLLAEASDTARSRIDYLGFLGVLAARMGEAQEARRIAAELASLRRLYSFGASELWRARLAAVLGEREQSVVLLKEAMAKGVVFGLWLHRDIDFESLRGYAPYEEFVRPRG